MQAASVALWYARMPHRTTLAADVWPLAVVFACGFVLALIVPRASVRHAVALGVTMAVVTGVEHVFAFALGVPVDVGGAGALAPMLLLLVPVHVALTLTGAVVAWLLRIVLGSARRPQG